MILNSFKLHTAIVQIHYSEAFELWDNAGAIARKLHSIWPDLKTSDAKPHQQVLAGNGINIETGFTKSTITLSGEKSFDKNNIQKIAQTFEIWREALDLQDLIRVSTRVTYCKDFPTLKEANSELIALNLVRWPNTKVFNQATDSDLNSLDLLYRFQDEQSFSVLKIKVEQVRYQVDLDPYFIEQPKIEKDRNRMVIDFDRGLLGTVNADKLRMDDWIKGFQHVLNRDIEKVIKVEV